MELKYVEKVVFDTLDDEKSEVLERNKTIRISDDLVFIERFQRTLKIKLVSLCPKLKIQERDTMGGDLLKLTSRLTRETDENALHFPCLHLQLSLVLMVFQCDRVKDGERK